MLGYSTGNAPERIPDVTDEHKKINMVNYEGMTFWLFRVRKLSQILKISHDGVWTQPFFTKFENQEIIVTDSILNLK